MVGLFSKFSVTRASSHRRTQSALEEREAVPPNTEATGAATNTAAAPIAAAHGVEVALEFKPVEHPMEPMDNDQPVQCPLPEPSILNDGRIWKERASAAGVRRKADVPLMKGGGNGGSGGDSEGGSGKSKMRPPSNRMIMPSMSAPEHDILNLLEECKNASPNY